MAFTLNASKKLVQIVRKGLEKKGGHCPCRVDKLPEYICPCVEFQETEHCKCGLFIKKECECKGGM